MAPNSTLRLLAALLLALPVMAGNSYPKSGGRLDQGWSESRIRTFWHEDQGSMLMPMEWFRQLKSKDGKTPLSAVLEQYGFIADPDRKSLPIGVSSHYDK